MIYRPDAKGWYWHEKVRIRLGYAAFCLMEWLWFKPLNWLSRRRVWAYESNIWLSLAAEGYLIDDLRRGDLPENVRIGGYWR